MTTCESNGVVAYLLGRYTASLLAGMLVLAVPSHALAAEATAGPYRIATFVADITSPIGDVLDCGLDAEPSRATRIEHPLLAKGIVLGEGANTYVLCALDLVGLCNGSHDEFREVLARAAGTTSERVAVHVLHQHTAPCFDTDSQRILDEVKGPPTTGLEHYRQALANTAQAVEAAWKKPRAVTHVGTGWAVVDRVASSRRLPQPDGSILTRLSTALDPLVRMAPEGVIDAYLRTVSFFDRSTPIVRLHYYATHPQTIYGDGRVTYDVPGLARERLEKESGVFQVYFNGCGGDLAMGKYNDRAPANRADLAARVYDAMKRSTANEKTEAIPSVRWSAEPVRLAPSRNLLFSDNHCREVVRNPRESSRNRIQAAEVLAYNQRARDGRVPLVTCLTIGSVRILGLPGETFVEYQHHAQRTLANGFVAVAGYGDCGMWYIGTDRTYSDRGGFEQTYSFVGPSEAILNRAIDKSLQSRP